jgi:hypothetical protein
MDGAGLMTTEVLVRLDLEEWQRVLAVLAQAPWSTANPLIMKIGEQLRAHTEPKASTIRMPDGEVRQ